MRGRLTTIAEKIKAAKACCKAAFSKPSGFSFSDLFNRDWEVLVIKKDADSGEYRTKILCCEEAST